MKSVFLAASVLFLLLAGIEAQEGCDKDLALSETSCPRGSAPRDGFSFCTTGPDFVDSHIFPDNWRIIFDNYHYFSLITTSTSRGWLGVSMDLNFLMVSAVSLQE